MNITCGVENSFNGGKTEKMLVWEMSQRPSPVLPLLHLLPYTFFFSPFFSLFLHPPSDPLPEHTSALRQQWGTDKPALMKMNVPTWSPIEFHYEVYLSGAGSQAPGSVLLGSLQACCGETPAQANLSGAALPQPGPRREKWNDSLAFCHFLSVPFCRLSPLLHGLSYQTEKPLAVAVLLSPFCLDVHLSVTLCVSVILAPAHHQKKKRGDEEQINFKSFIHPSSLWILCWSTSELFGGAVHLIAVLHVRHFVNQSKWAMSPATSQTRLIIFWH